MKFFGGGFSPLAPPSSSSAYVFADYGQVIRTISKNKMYEMDFDPLDSNAIHNIQVYTDFRECMTLTAH